METAVGDEIPDHSASQPKILFCITFPLVRVVERSKVCTVFARSEARIVDSIPTQGMDVWCVFAFFCVCVVLYLGRGLATSWSPVQGVLPSVNDKETEKSDLYSKLRIRGKKILFRFYYLLFIDLVQKITSYLKNISKLTVSFISRTEIWYVKANV
jgi:hypothetical protein